MDHRRAQRYDGNAVLFHYGDDFDGDGIPDLAIGSDAFLTRERVYLFNPATSALLRTLSDPSGRSQTGFGESVATVGDLTGDGVPEIAVGAENTTSGVGIVYIF